MPAELDRPQNRRRWAVAAAAVLSLLALFYFTVEWVDETLDLGYGEEARRNPLLAAELFLEAEGIEAETVIGFNIFDELPSPRDVLILTGTRRALSERRTLALVDWVGDGGHLVVVAEQVFDLETGVNPDRLLDEFGISLDACEEAEVEEEAEEEQTDPEAAVEEPIGLEEDLDNTDERLEKKLRELLRENLAGKLRECWGDEAERTTVHLAYDIDPEVELDSCKGLWSYHDDTPDPEDGTPRSPPQLIQVDYGSGRVTAATSLAIFGNTRIHCADHAFLLRHLAQNGDKTWLLADPDIPLITSLLWSAMPLACVSFAIWLLVGAASRSLPIGLHVPATTSARRELLEHLEASAHFLWRQDLLAAGVEELREEIQQRARRQRRDFETLSRGERAFALAEISKLPAASIDFAMVADVSSKRQEFTLMMQTLQSIRRRL